MGHRGIRLELGGGGLAAGDLHGFRDGRKGERDVELTRDRGADVDLPVDGLKALDLDVQLVGIEGDVEELVRAVARSSGVGLESGDVVSKLNGNAAERLPVGTGDRASDRSRGAGGAGSSSRSRRWSIARRVFTR